MAVPRPALSLVRLAITLANPYSGEYVCVVKPTLRFAEGQTSIVSWTCEPGIFAPVGTISLTRLTLDDSGAQTGDVDDPGVQTGDVVLLGTFKEQAQYLVGQTFNFTPNADTAHNREIGSPILYPSGTDYHHVSETRYRITKVNKTAMNSATVSGVKLKFNSPDTGEWFIGFSMDGGSTVDCNTYNSTALAPIPYTIGSNITTPVATFKVTRAEKLPTGVYAVYGTHVSGIVS